MKRQDFFKILSLFLCIMGSAALLSGQKLHKPASIIDASGKVLEGYIAVGPSLEAYQSVQFSKQKNGPFERLLPTDIQEYRFKKLGIRFVSAEVPTLDQNQLPTNETIHCFLQVLNSGPLEILEFKGKGQHFFYMRKDEGEPELLSYKLIPATYREEGLGRVSLANGESFENLVPGMVFSDSYGKKYLYDGTKVSQLATDYHGKLNQETADCQDMQLHSSDLELKKRDLLLVAKKYGDCKPAGSYNQISSRPWIQLSLLPYINGSQFFWDTYRTLEYGAMLDLRWNSFSPNISLSIGQGFSKGSLLYWESVVIDNSANMQDQLYRSETTLRTNLLRLNYQFFPGKNLRPYISAGLKAYGGNTVNYNFYEEFATRTSQSIGILSEHFAVGLDYFFLGFNQLKLEMSWSGTPEFRLAYGWLLTK